jgi:multidrug resistance efflux pump
MQSATVAAEEPKQVQEQPSSALPHRILLPVLLALGAGAAAAFWLEHVQYEQFPAFLQARLRTVAPVRDGEIAEILVAPGALVTAGKPLVRLKDAQFDRRFEGKKREVESLEIEVAQSEARLEVELEWRRKDILERIFEAKLKLGEAQRRERQPPFGSEWLRGNDWGTTGSELVEPRRRGDQGRFVDPISLAGGEDPSAGGVPISEAELCKRYVQELERLDRELPGKISRSMGVDLARSRLAHARAELAELESQKGELTLVAETSGLVGVFQKQAGDHVAAHETIVQILDEEQPYLLLQIPSPRISDFAPGTVVDLLFPGGRKGKGRVEEIPPQTSPIPGERGSAGETIVTAHVEPVGALWPDLPFGSMVEVRRRR